MRSRSSIVDAVVDVAHLDVERDVGAEEALDVAAGPSGEVVADLVAGDVAGAARPRAAARW